MAGEAQLFRTERLGGGMNTTTAQFAQNMGFDEDDRIVVPAISLPAVIEREAPARIRLCKIDCEGAELEIIESLGLAEMERIDAFAIEFHREAYSPIRLVEALEHSGTHQVFPAGPKSYGQRNILYALSIELLREIVLPEARLAAATSCCE